MADQSPHSPSMPAGAWSPAKAIIAACLGHAMAWSLLPPLFLGNLHTDTVEILSWATHWDWGYVKHPPLIVWLFNAVVALPGSRMLNLLILSQAMTLVSALFIWRTVRLYLPAPGAGLAALIFIASPPASFFAAQVNHNTLTIPFGAAIFCFGLGFLEHRRGRGALALGLSAGLAMLVKYQAAFFLITLVALALAIPRYRWVWRDWRGYAAAAPCLALFAPHVLWDFEHGWRTILYASADRPLRTIGDFGASLNELLDGLLMWAVGPMLAWLVLGRPRPRFARGPLFQLGAWIAATPVAIMVALGFASDQILRQGWLVPLVPALAIGLPLMAAETPLKRFATAKALVALSIAVSLGQVLAFAGFLLARAAGGSPVAAFSLDGKVLTTEVQRVWRGTHDGPIPCILMPNRTFGLATMLYFAPIPEVIDLPPLPDADSLAGCRPTGGIALIPDGAPANAELRALGLQGAAIEAPAWPWGGAYRWKFNVFLIEKAS